MIVVYTVQCAKCCLKGDDSLVTLGVLPDHDGNNDPDSLCIRWGSLTCPSSFTAPSTFFLSSPLPPSFLVHLLCPPYMPPGMCVVTLVAMITPSWFTLQWTLSAASFLQVHITFLRLTFTKTSPHHLSSVSGLSVQSLPGGSVQLTSQHPSQPLQPPSTL